MKIKFLGCAILALLFLISCEEEGDDPQPRVSSISVTISPTIEFFGVGEDVTFTVAMDSDPSVGITSLVIKKGTDLIFENTYSTNQVKLNFSYKTVREDIELGTIPFTFEMTDGNGQLQSFTAEIMIQVDFPFQQEGLRPNPSWDLVNNEAVADTAGDNVDIYQFQLTTDFSTTTYWRAKNGTVLFDISDKQIDFFDPNLTVEQLLAVLEGVEAVETLQMSAGGFGASTFTSPTVAKLRGKEEYVLIDFTNIQGTNLGYRKTSEQAGE